MKKKKAVIIDDEPFARDDLRYLLLQHPEIDVIGEAETVHDAEELIKRVSPDIIFLDIQLRGGSGFDLVPQISSSSRVIFFSAYDEFVENASVYNAHDYLLKPVIATDLASSLRRLE